MNQNPAILIVDDDLAGRESLKGVLLSQGYELIEAEDGLQAIKLAQEHIPDLILLDVMMPELDGFEVCRRLRSDPLLAEIPILMITALDDRSSRLAGIDAGADDFIAKPYDRVELRARVRTVTRLNRYRRLVLERARFVWVIENDRDGYLILDEQGAIQYANAAARLLFNLPPGEEDQPIGSFIERAQQNFMQVPPSQWKNWPEIENEEAALYLVKQPEQNNENAETLRRPQWFEVRLLDLPWGTKQQRLLRVQEITDRMALQLETWSFQAAVNHKLMTPLSNILLSVQLMKMLAKTQETQDLLEIVDGVEAGFRRLEGEIKDILQFVHAANLANVGNNLPIADLESLVGHIAQSLSIDELTYQNEAPILPQQRLMLSHRAMQVILWEILENSKKFHPQLAPSVKVTLNVDPQGVAVIQVCDNGTALSPQDLSNALKPYYQGEKLFTGEVSGMGLGLPTVAALVWQVGGDIALRNRQDRPGLIVELRIPVN